MGERIGKYELLSKIATGGMAEIHVAQSIGIPGVDKVVVIKRLLAAHATQPEFIEMFLDEARVVASLNHPNIVQMYDFGSAPAGTAGSTSSRDEYFMAMEWLHGEDLRTIHRHLLADRQKMPLPHVLTIVTAVAAGLHHAHDSKTITGDPLQVVHRDVSPHNVVVTFDGAVKLVDFGIAKSKNRVSETRHGTIKGKVPYMAPEQLRTEPLDRRVDIYALGIILYELATGHRPYIMTSPGEFGLMMAIARGKIRLPTEARPDLSPDLADIIMKALARKPAERFQTARDFASALESFAAKSNITLSANDLGTYMHGLFKARLARWEKARAQGKPFADHVIEQLEADKRRSAAGADPDDSELIDTSSLPKNWDASDEEDATSSITDLNRKRAKAGLPEIAAPPAPTSTPSLAGLSIAGVDINARRVGDVDVVSLAGRISETFMGRAVGSVLRGVVVLDLAHVERISSFGVREWLEMMTAAQGNVDELYLARLSEAVATQMGMIRSFAGKGKLVSFYAPYICDACGKSQRRLFDCERDAQHIQTRTMPPGQCVTCGKETILDEDPVYLAFAAPFAGSAIPPAVRSALDTLVEGDAPTTPGEVIEKLVQGNVTRLRVRSALDRTLRWNRVFDGLEGAVVIDFQSPLIAKEAAASLSQALRGMGPEVTSVDISSCPLVVLESVSSNRSARIRISSVFVEGQCATCKVMRSSLIGTEDFAKSSAMRVPCRRCNTPLAIAPALLERLKSALVPPPPGGGAKSGVKPTPRPTPAPTSVSVKRGSLPELGPTSRLRNRVLAVVGTVVGMGVFGVVIAFVLGQRNASLKTQQTSASASAASALAITSPPPPAASSLSASAAAPVAEDPLPVWAASGQPPFVRQNGAVLLVGQSGNVASEEEGLALARADAVRVLAGLVLSEMRKGNPTVNGFAPLLEGPSPADGRVLSHEELRMISDRFLRMVGSTATPERTEVVARRTGNGLAIHARYTLPERGLESAVTAYSKTIRVGGVTFTNVFPLAATKHPADAHVMVAVVDEKVPLAKKTELKAGDIVLKVATPGSKEGEERPALSLDNFNALVGSATTKAKTLTLIVRTAASGEQKRVILTR